MPEIGDTWSPSMPFPETDREKQETRDQERERNRKKNMRRKEAKEKQKTLPVKRVAAGKQLRRAFGGAFGRAPENVKFMAAQGTTMDPEKQKEEVDDIGTNFKDKNPRGKKEKDNG